MGMKGRVRRDPGTDQVLKEIMDIGCPATAGDVPDTIFVRVAGGEYLGAHRCADDISEEWKGWNFYKYQRVSGPLKFSTGKTLTAEGEDGDEG